MTVWTRIQDNPTAVTLKGAIDWNAEKKGLYYHNYSHVEDMYNFLSVREVPYSAELDWAVLLHDFVYDPQPFKEERSSALSTYFDLGAGAPHKVRQMILATRTHRLSEYPGCEDIIRADLAGLSRLSSAEDDFFKLLLESRSLYCIGTKNFCENNCDFMEGLKATVSENKEVDLDCYTSFWTCVQKGIEQTQKLARSLYE